MRGEHPGETRAKIQITGLEPLELPRISTPTLTNLTYPRSNNPNTYSNMKKSRAYQQVERSFEHKCIIKTKHLVAPFTTFTKL